MEQEEQVELVRHTSLMVVPAVSLDPVYVRPVQEAPVEMDDLSGAAQRTTVWCVFGRALRMA